MIIASRLDPRSGIITLNIGNGFEGDDDLASAQQWYRRAIHTEEPYFRLAFQTLVGMHLTRSGRLDEAARWARAWRRLGPDDIVAGVFEQDAYLNLDALDLARTRLGDLVRLGTSEETGSKNLARWAALIQAISTERRLGNFEKVSELASQFSNEYLEDNPDWPNLQRNEYVRPIMTAWTLADLQAGLATQAFERMQAAYPGPLEDIALERWEPLPPEVMLGSLYKAVGNEKRGMAWLRACLEYLHNPRKRVSPWSEFTLLAMLGETEAALDVMERVVDSGYVYMWWALRDGAFDPDYAKVIAAPRFESLYQRLVERVDAQRESFLAQPELPEELRP